MVLLLALSVVAWRDVYHSTTSSARHRGGLPAVLRRASAHRAPAHTLLRCARDAISRAPCTARLLPGAARAATLFVSAAPRLAPLSLPRAFRALRRVGVCYYLVLHFPRAATHHLPPYSSGMARLFAARIKPQRMGALGGVEYAFIATTRSYHAASRAYYAATASARRIS